MKLWLFYRHGDHLVYDIPLKVVVRSSTYNSAIRVFEKEHIGFSADDYEISELKQNGRSEVVCTDIMEG